MKTLLLFVLSLLTYAAFDVAWLNLFAKKFVQRQVGHHMAPNPDLVAALVFYLIFTAGLLYFCVLPAGSQRQALFNGAFFGLVTYGTYELVNRALLDKWPLPMVLVDMSWGVLAAALVSCISFNLNAWLDSRL